MSGIKLCELITANGQIKDNNQFLFHAFNFSVGWGQDFAGVYMIGDFYIGRSDSIRKRLIRHAQKALKGNHFNADFQTQFDFHISNDYTMPVKILSYQNTVSVENNLIKDHIQKGYNLVNKFMY